MSKGRQRIVLLSVLAYGLLFRLAFLFDPYRVDEAYTFFNFARFPLSEIGRLYSNTNNHFLHSMLVHVCYKAMGLSELSLRLPAFLCGMAAIYATYEVAHRLQDDPAVPIVAAGLVAGSSTFLLYSVYSRGYTLQTSLALAVMLLVLRKDAWVAWWKGPLALALGGFLIVYAVPSGIVFVIPLYLWQFIRTKESPADNARVRVLFSAAASLLLMAAAFFRVASNFPALAAYNAYPIGNVQFLKETASLISSGLLPRPLFLAAVAVGIYRCRPPARFVLTVLSLSYLGAALLLSGIAVQFRFFPRSYIVLFPFFYILAAIGIVTFVREAARHRHGRWLASLGSAALVANLAWANLHLVNHKEALEQGDPTRFYYRRLIKPLADHLREGEIVQGTDSLSDTMGAIYTVQQRGFSGHYGLGNLQKEPVHAIYLVGPRGDSVFGFFQKNLASDGWSAPVLMRQEGPVVAFRTEERPNTSESKRF